MRILVTIFGQQTWKPVFSVVQNKLRLNPTTSQYSFPVSCTKRPEPRPEQYNHHLLASVLLQNISFLIRYWLLCRRGQPASQRTACVAEDSLCRRGQPVLQRTACVAEDSLRRRGQPVLQRTACVAEDSLCRRGQPVLQRTACVAEDSLCCRGQPVLQRTACVAEDSLCGRQSPEQTTVLCWFSLLILVCWFSLSVLFYFALQVETNLQSSEDCRLVVGMPNEYCLETQWLRTYVNCHSL